VSFSFVIKPCQIISKTVKSFLTQSAQTNKKMAKTQTGTTLRETTVTKNKGSVYFISSVWKLLYINSYTLLSLLSKRQSMMEGQLETVNYIDGWCTVSVIEKTLNYLVNATDNILFNVAFLLLLIHSLLLWVILLFSPSRLGKQESTVYRKGYPFLYCFINSIIRRVSLCHISILYLNYS